MFFCSVESGGVFVHSLICYSINFIIWSFPIMSGWHGRFWKKWKCFCWRLLTLKTGFFRYFSKSFQGVDRRDIWSHKTCFLWCACCTFLVQYMVACCLLGFFLTNVKRRKLLVITETGVLWKSLQNNTYLWQAYILSWLPCCWRWAGFFLLAICKNPAKRK